MILADCFPPEQRKLVELGGPKMSVTNVAEYYFHHDQEYWLLDEFKQAIPPFEKMWVEYRYPKMVRSTENGGHLVQAYFRGMIPYFGCFVSKINARDSVEYFPEENLRATIEETKKFILKNDASEDYRVNQDPSPSAQVDTWLFKGTMYFVNQKNQVDSYGDVAEIAVRMDREGRILAHSFPKFMEEPFAGLAGVEAAATRAYYLLQPGAGVGRTEELPSLEGGVRGERAQRRPGPLRTTQGRQMVREGRDGVVGPRVGREGQERVDLAVQRDARLTA